MQWPEVNPEMLNYVMCFKAADTEHSGLHFRNTDMGRGTQHISAAETAADMSNFMTHVGVAEIQAKTSRFS